MALGGEGFASIARIEELLLMEDREVPKDAIRMAQHHDKETTSLLEVIPERYPLENSGKLVRDV